MQDQSIELGLTAMGLLSFANSLDIDITTAVRDKLSKNARKYPEDEYKGRF